MKAWDAYSQLLAQLDAAGERVMVGGDWPELSGMEERIMDLIDAEKVGKDTDEAYESMREAV